MLTRDYTQFTSHPHVHPQMEQAILPLLPSAEHHHNGWYLFSRPPEVMRLSWPGWLVTY